MEKIKSIYGYFDRADQKEPTYEPGLDVNCPLCGNKLDENNLKTICFMDANKRNRSYFYRTHKTCYEAAPQEKIWDIEHVKLGDLN